MDYPTDVKEKISEEDRFTKFHLAVAAIVITGVLAFFIYSYFTSKEYLVGRLYSSSAKTRRWAVDQLVKKGDKMGIEMKRLALDKKQNKEARRLAIFVMGEIKYEKAIDDLRGIFEQEELPLKEQAVYAMGRIGNPIVIPDLVNAYKRAPKGLKLKILTALGEIGNRAGTMLLIEALDSNDDLIQQAASLALKKVRKKSNF